MRARHSRLLAVAAAGTLAMTLAGCGSDQPARRTSSASSAASTPAPTQTVPSSTPAPVTTTTRTTHRPKPTTTAPRPPSTATRSTHHRASSGAPVIVLDPGHSVAISATDPATGLDVSDYENEPEMRDVFSVALLVRSQLQAAGYRVVMTKTSLDQRRSLGQRAQIARDAHADLALSIHDQAGGNGGIGFRSGNNIVYYQSVGTYRSNSQGHRTYFTDSSLAARSKRYGEQFRTERNRVQGVPIRLQGNVGYDLGGRGLAGGNIWMVQLLSHVPWIYNEAGGNSAGQTGLNSADKATYATSLVDSVEHCIPPPH